MTAIRSDVVLELEDERRRGCQRLRYQRRHVRSVAAGTITVTYRSGRTFLLPRTNNLSETGFRDLKRRQRRTTGNGDLSRQIDHMPPQVLYAANLSDPNYCRLVFGDRPIHEAFAAADWTAVKTAVADMAAPVSPGAVDRELVGSPGFFATVGAALTEELGEWPASPVAAIPLTP